MEELTTLRHYIEQGLYEDALLLIDELEEMSKEDKLNKIFSYAVILLIHLIKRQAEQRTTRSWDISIYQAAQQIKRINKRRKSGGYYASPGELQELLNEAIDLALKKASLEVSEGRYDEAELSALLDLPSIIAEAQREIIE
jgi:hypothetical protein